jgi:replication factor C subunit 3/5
MFLIDQYNKNTHPHEFNNEIIQLLQKMVSSDSIPHIIMNIPHGSNGEKILNYYLELLYDSNVHKLNETIYKVNGSGSNIIEVAIKQSNYHIVIDPTSNNFDRYLIQDVIKEYAKNIPLTIFRKKRIFKTVVVNNLDKVPFYAQTSLRRTLEKYSDNCRFIMLCTSMSKVIEPLRSRCICINFKAPTHSELFDILYYYSMKNNISINLTNLSNIIYKSKRDIYKALWLFDAYKYNIPLITSYDSIVNKICDTLFECKIIDIVKLRDMVYKIIITNIETRELLKDIFYVLSKHDNISEEDKLKILEIICEFECRISNGRREMIHLDCMFIKLIRIIQKV